MTLAESLYTFLTTATAVVAIAEDRGYPIRAAQGAALPMWVYTLVSDNEIDDISRNRATLAETRLQIDCYGDAAVDARELAMAIESAIIGFYGTMGGGVFISSIRKVNRVETDQPESGAFRIMSEFEVFHYI